MFNKFHLFFLLLMGPVVTASAQQEAGTETDTTYQLSEVIVQAYDHGRSWQDVPVSIGVLNEPDLQRFNNTSLLPVMNTIPGVRMEERSPGSYRLSIRGSTLRSPFGIRNVKVYWNNLPFTDPGGNTYLNLLDFSAIRQAEIIKGPGGSLYGAGTGGVVLLKAPKAGAGENSIQLTSTAGSFGLWRYAVSAQHADDNSNIIVQYAHQQSDGYREQTNMVRDFVQMQGSFETNEHQTISANIFYSDLVYQTPGGLTKAQFDENPKQARPPGGPNPGAVEQMAGIYNKTFFAGLTHDYQWNTRWSNKTGVYGSFTRFENPFITNFEKRVEQSLGGRTATQYQFAKGHLNFGAEFQHGYSPISVYDNNAGSTGDLQNSDEISSTSSLAFAQMEFFLPHEFFLTAGASLNFFKVHYTRLSDTPAFDQDKSFDPVLSPRLALLKKFDFLSVYSSISRGFSPPTVAELFPSTAVFNSDLNPEQGTNIEVGTKGNFLDNRLSVDLTLYSFQLDETIVIRRTDEGDDYFINAGETKQQGAELMVSWRNQPSLVKPTMMLWSSLTLNRYLFQDYIKDTDDYSDNNLTGVPPMVFALGADFSFKGFYANITYTYTDEIPLNDANTVFADAYQLINARIGYRKGKPLPFDVFAGVDNALDEKYSLGNDLNAFGGRYFNAAMPVNFYIGFSANINTKGKSK